jgi:Uma2 family endonuclease
MISARSEHFITEAEYLAMEEVAEEKHEYCDGRIYAMAGARQGHELVALAFAAELRRHLLGSGCRTFKSDMKVRAIYREKALFYYPDVFVACGPADDRAVFREDPKLIVEVLSEDWKKDLAEKLAIYKHIPSLEEYVVADPRSDAPEVFLYRRADGWEPPEIVQGMDAQFTLRSVGLTLKVADLFAV